MGGHVLIVDRDPARRAALRGLLGLPAGELRDAPEPADLPVLVAAQRPDLLLLDLDDPAEPLLDALRWLRRRAGDPLPAIALVPPDQPDLRLAALAAGAEDACDRDVSPRILQARVRSLLRERDATLELAPREEGTPIIPGLGEAPAAFTHALFAPGQAPASPAPRARVALLSPLHSGASPSPETVARLLEADVVRLASAADISQSDADSFDLVLLDGAGLRGDLAQGTVVLGQLADLQGRLRARQTATLVLLPATAVETAALALDLGASDVVAGSVAPHEVVLRARALVARNRLRQALRDQVRLGLRAAMTDPLTGLHNRRYADGALRRLGDGVRQSRRGLALVMIDIDHFKRLNDTHGHALGDRVLVEVAARLRSVLRPNDLLARVGGEEFLVALPDAGPEEAARVAERLRAAIGQVPFPLDPDPAQAPWGAWRDAAPFLPRRASPCEGGAASASDLRVTVSVGVAAASARQMEAGLSLADLLKLADDALYEAKKTGRNAVASAPEAA